MAFEVYTWRPLPQISARHSRIRQRLVFESIEFDEIHPRLMERRMCESAPKYRADWRELRAKFARVAV
jgi:hypothetical protein